MISKTAVERAFELARSGEFSRWNDVAKMLKREGYLGVTSHFSGMHIRKQINALCLLAQDEATQRTTPADNGTECEQGPS